MATTRLISILVIVSLCGACIPYNEAISDMPIDVSLPKTQSIDIGLVIENAHREVDKVLPGATLGFFSFTGLCQNLTNFQGEVLLYFTQTHWGLFGNRVYVARVSVDTSQKAMSIAVRDETEHYPSTDTLAVEGKKIAEIAALLHDHLQSTNKCDNTVVLAKSTTDGPWRVRCGPRDVVLNECMEIDPVSGAILEKN